jgi:diaminopimelate epimerase
MQIDLPGGNLQITFLNGKMIMRGPAVLEETGTLPENWFIN